MRKISLIFAVLVFFTFTSAYAQKRYLSGDQIPAKITSFVQKNFPQAKIEKVKEEKDILETEYEVKLSSRTELEFDGKYAVTEIESKSGVPAGALPQKVQNYLKENYSNTQIKEWKRECKGQKVKLHNGTKLYFYPNGKFAGKK